MVQKLLRKARKGATIIYVPGNHDEFLRDFLGTHFGGIEVRDRDIHETADGTHAFWSSMATSSIVVVRNARWLAYLGDWAYDLAILLNTAA